MFQTQINSHNEIFQRNAAAMQTLVNDLKEKLAHIQQGGDKAARERHHQHGK